MTSPRRWYGSLVVGVLAACTTTPQYRQPTVGLGLTTTLDALVADSIGNLLLDRLIHSENTLTNPDSLFASQAIVLADGEPRLTVPRLAGGGLGGNVQVVSTRLSSVGRFVWGVVEYRWVPLFASDALHQGIATIVIGELPEGGWRILHLHSSSPSTDGTPSAPPPTGGGTEPARLR